MKFLVLIIFSMNIYANCKIDIHNLKLLTYKKIPVYDEKKGEVVQKRIEFNSGIPPYPDLVELIVPKTGLCKISEVKVQQLVAPIKTKDPKKLIKGQTFVYKLVDESKILRVTNLPLEKALDTSKGFHVFQLKIIIGKYKKVLDYPLI